MINFQSGARRASLSLTTALAMAAAMTVTVAAGAKVIAAANEAIAEPDSLPAVTVSHATHAAVLDTTPAGSRLVAVGERGVVLFSDDQGQSWQQAQVPSSVTLTAVSFADDKNGWAVGHYGLVLHSSDGGESWQVQLDGAQAAQLILAEVEQQTAGDSSRKAKRKLFSAKRLVSDGPDKPFLDVWFADSQHGLIVGAYGLAFKTSDGGNSWQPLIGRIDNHGERHLYSIAADANNIYLAGEEGLLFRAPRTSRDSDLAFERLYSPYGGSFFTISASNDELVVAGLRGNAFVSRDQGDSWNVLQLPSEASVVDSEMSNGGELMLINQAGQFLIASRNEVYATQVGVEPGLAPTAILSMNDGRVLLSGLQGMTAVSLSDVRISSN